MHELSLVEEILHISSAAARGRTVKRVVLKVGVLSCVMPEALQFCFDSVKQDTLLHHAELVLEPVPGLAHCETCGTDYALAELWQPCPCGSVERRLLQGQELVVQTLEFC